MPGFVLVPPVGLLSQCTHQDLAYIIPSYYHIYTIDGTGSVQLTYAQGAKSTVTMRNNEFSESSLDGMFLSLWVMSKSLACNSHRPLK